MMFCQNCGQQILDDSKFCPACGHPVNQATGEPAGEPSVEPAGTQAQTPTPPEPLLYPQPLPAPKPKYKKGWLIGIIIAAVAIIAIVVAVLAGGSFGFTTAKLTEAAIASEIDAKTKAPVTKTDTFNDNAPVIYATALLTRAPADTKITAKWLYLTDDIEIASVDVMSTETSQYVSFSLTMPDEGFPAGDYQVELFIEDKLKETLTFKVIAVTRFAEAAMASEIDPATNGPVITTSSFMTDSPMIYATALLKNAPDKTKVTAIWYYLPDNQEIASVDIQSSEPSQYISFSLSRPDAGFPDGDYKVELYIEDALQQTLAFTVVAVARLSEATMASEVDSVTQKPIQEAKSFPSDTPVIYATVLLTGAPKDTLVTAKWYDVTNSTALGTVDFHSTEMSQYISFTLEKPEAGFPAGSYQVEFYLNNTLETTLGFDVTQANPLKHEAMSFLVDPYTLEPLVITSVFFEDTPIIYATALLENAPIGTVVYARWIYVTDQVDINTVDIQSTESTQYIAFYLNMPADGFPTGDYKVQLYLGQDYVTELEFTVQASLMSEAVMASEVDPVTLEPVMETNVFSTSAPFIYVTALIHDVPVGTEITADWYSINDDLSINTMSIDTTLASQYVAFYLTKPDAGFSPGEYLVDLYIGDLLARTLMFTIE